MAALTIQTAQASSSNERAYAAAINDVRRAHGLNSLTEEQALVESARGHSADMVDNGYFAHGAEWWKRLVHAGSAGPRLGENLGWCATSACLNGSPAQVIRAWLASPEHRKNMLDPDFRHLGVGISMGPFNGYRNAVVVTTDFDG